MKGAELITSDRDAIEPENATRVGDARCPFGTSEQNLGALESSAVETVDCYSDDRAQSRILRGSRMWKILTWKSASNQKLASCNCSPEQSSRMYHLGFCQ